MYALYVFGTCMWVHSYMHIHAEARAGHQCLLNYDFLHCCFEKGSLTELKEHHLSEAGWPTNSCHVGFIGTWSQDWLFMWVLGIQTRVFMLSLHWVISPTPKWFLPLKICLPMTRLLKYKWLIQMIMCLKLINLLQTCELFLQSPPLSLCSAHLRIHLWPITANSTLLNLHWVKRVTQPSLLYAKYFLFSL